MCFFSSKRAPTIEAFYKGGAALAQDKGKQRPKRFKHLVWIGRIKKCVHICKCELMLMTKLEERINYFALQLCYY